VQDKWLQPATSLINDAHAVGLKVHTWTFRQEEPYLAPDYNGNPQAEYEQFFKLGIDGVFSDFLILLLMCVSGCSLVLLDGLINKARFHKKRMYRPASILRYN
jgi:hypothetical protein